MGQGGLNLHSTAPSLGKRDTAERTLTRAQVLAIGILVMGSVVGIWAGWSEFLIGVIGAMMMTYIIVLCYKSWAVYYSLKLLILEDRTKHPGEGLAYWNV